METRARYAVIGAFVLACIFAAFGFVYWLQNSSGLGQTVYRIQFDQPVSGLTTGSSVLFNGIRVGAILSLKLDPQDPKRVVTTIAVDPATPIRADTQVDISFQGLTGAPAISLRGGSANAPILKAQNGQPAELKSGPEVGQNLTEFGARDAEENRRHPGREQEAAEHGDQRPQHVCRHAREKFRAARRPDRRLGKTGRRRTETHHRRL